MNKSIVATAIVAALLSAAGCAAKGSALLASDEHYRLGVIYSSNAKTDLALKQFEYAVAADPENWKAHLLAGNIHLEAKELKEAREHFTVALESSPDNPLLHNNLAWTLMEEGKLDEAQAHAVKAVGSENGQRHVFLDTLGMVLMKKGESEKAGQAFSDALSSAPQSDVEGIETIRRHIEESRQASKEQQ